MNPFDWTFWCLAYLKPEPGVTFRATGWANIGNGYYFSRFLFLRPWRCL